MSKQSQRDSQVLDSSLPSEPPDIGNWFSSYVYESPELKNRDDFEDYEVPGSRINYTANGKEGKLTGNVMVGKCINSGDKGSSYASLNVMDQKILNQSLRMFSKTDGFKVDDSANKKDNNLGENGTDGKRNPTFIAGEKGSSYAFAKRNDPIGFADFKSAAEIMESSDTQPFSLEPLGIKNWFSSYVYESPLSNYASFTVSDFKEREVKGKVYVAEIDNSKLEDKSRDFTEVGNSSDLLNQRRISAVIVRCNSLVKEGEHDQQPISEDSCEAAGMQSLSVLNDLTSGRIPQEISPPKRQQNHDKGLMEESRKSKDDGDYSGKSDCQSSDTKLSSENQDRKSLQKLIERKDYTEISPKEKHIQVDCESVQPSTLSLTILEQKSMKKLAERRNEKENIEGTELAENGFISTRKSKSREVNSENIERPHRIPPKSLRNGVTISSNRNEDSKTTRKVLCETTNFQQYANAIESRGKWRCPQKSKPELGPPLKQLRLERWIRPS
ncbi:uncharacterized protein LOC111388166 [Olea europaea var. sylvestris]|uniref:uncharacterized protein LOC111388166 n=1 Tax=Olea europaea var. sylvestris TaxID=158386 RepID=UPI000C1CF43D|nr:uncharacterized protein LOC111388166 [Olea europaea var. sylvestris]